MARLLPQTLAKIVNQTLSPASASVPSHSASRLLASRSQSTRQPMYGQLNDPNLVEPSSSSSEFEQKQQMREEALALVRRIEDVIHDIIMRRSAPDWLPFIPGTSYWVPPRRRSYGISQMVQNLSNHMTEEEAVSLITGRGWPSSEFFLKHDSKPDVETTSLNTMTESQSEEVMTLEICFSDCKSKP